MCNGIHRVPRALILGVSSANTEGRRLRAVEDRNVRAMAAGVPNSLNQFLVRTFYRFVPLQVADLPALQDEYRKRGNALGLVGTVLLSPEGLNATVAGTPDAVEEFCASLLLRFSPLSYLDTRSEVPPFVKFKVSVKPRLVQGGDPPLEADSAKENWADATQWEELRRQVRLGLAQMVDVRNSYEIELGTFPEAINPHTVTFKQFQEFLDREVGRALKTDLPTAIFCTGGIRCETAIEGLRTRGIEKIWQLKGGILRYLKESKEQGFEGECFVFDDRVALTTELMPTKKYKNCARCGGPVAASGEGHQCIPGREFS